MCSLSGVLLSETLAKLFLVQRGKMQEAVCLQDKWLEAFPCWFSRQTIDDGGGGGEETGAEPESLV